MLLVLSVELRADTNALIVYKTASCSCCAGWVDYMKANGFQVTVHNVESTAEYRHKYGIPDAQQSCHTALIGGYAIEGHVPANEVRRLLREHPKAAGLAVPGMIVGTPGMEQGPRHDPYAVLLVGPGSRVSSYQKYAGN